MRKAEAIEWGMIVLAWAVTVFVCGGWVMNLIKIGREPGAVAFLARLSGVIIWPLGAFYGWF